MEQVKLLTHQITQKEAITAKDIQPYKMVLTADQLGHFRGTVFMNGVPMPFMIDTGATLTTVPATMARKADLPLGRQYPVSTANGKAFQTATIISSLKIGYAELNDINGGINQTTDEVLLGMNTLNYFDIGISGNKMILSAKPSVRITSNFGSPTTPRKTKPITYTWKKSVICDENGEDCKTTYSE